MFLISFPSFPKMLRSGNRFAKTVVNAVVEMTEEHTRDLEKQLGDAESALSRTRSHFSELWWQAVPPPLHQRLRDTLPEGAIFGEDHAVAVIYAKHMVAWPCWLLNDIDSFLNKLVDNYDAFRIHAVSGDIIVICGLTNHEKCALTAATIAGELHECVVNSQRQSDTEECRRLQLGICNGTMHVEIVPSSPPRCNFLGHTVDNAREMCELSRPGLTIVTEEFRTLFQSSSSAGVDGFKFNVTDLCEVGPI